MTCAIQVPVGNGGFALVDACDVSVVASYRWWYKRSGIYTPYAQTRISGKLVTMHRLLLSAPPEMLVDHIDGNGLNNTRANLRLCTHGQNSRNTPARTGRFKGVSPTPYGTWRAVIHEGPKQIGLGSFSTEEAAAEAYDAAALAKQGEFARLNFPAPARPALVAHGASVAPDSVGLSRPIARAG